jgi:hypothetical protein
MRSMDSVSLPPAGNDLQASEQHLRLKHSAGNLRPTHVRNAVLGDYHRLSALQKRNAIPETPHERWVELCLGNPAAKELESSPPIGWVLETADDEIVGFIGNIPLGYRLNGRSISAAAGSSWVVDPEYRGYSMLILDRLIKQRGVDLLVFTTVAPNVEPLLNSFQFARVPMGSWNRSAFWVTRYMGFSNSILRTKSLRFGGVLEYPLAGVLFCRDALRRVPEPRVTSNYAVEQCRNFDVRFDEFWEELKNQNRDVLLAVRTREALAWHFQSALSRGRAWILTASQGQRLVAYAAFDRQDKPALGLKRVRVVDFQALNGSEDALPLLLSSALSNCRRQHIDMMEVIGDWLNQPKFPKIVAPYQRTLSSWIWYYKAKDAQLQKALREPRVWAPSSFDGDSSL